MLAVPAADLHPQLGLLELVGDRADDAVVLVEQLAPLVGLGGEALELAAGVLVGVVDVEGVLEGLERAVGVLLVLLEDLRHLLEGDDLELRVLEDLDLAGVEIDHLAPRPGVAVDRLERLVRGHVGGIEVEDLQVGAGGLGLVPELLLPDPRDLHQDVDLLLRRLDDLALLLEDLDHLVPGRLAGVQALEGGERLEAPRLELEDVPPGGDGRLRVHQVLGLDPTDLGVVGPDLLGAEDPRPERDQAGEDVVELHPLLVALVDRVQRRQRIDVAAVELERVEPGVEGAALLAQPLAVDPREVLVDRHLLVPVLDHEDLPLEDLRELLPPAVALVQDRQLAEGEAILAAELEHLGPQVDGLRLAAERLGRDLRHPLVARGGVLVGVGDRGHALVGLVELLPALPVEVERLEALQRLGVVPVDLERPVVSGDRRLRVRQPLLIGVGQPHLEVDQDLAVHGRLDPPLQDVGELLPATGRGEEPVLRLEGLRVVWHDGQEPAVDLDRPAGVADPTLEHLARASQHAHPRVLAEVLVLEDLLADVDDVAPLLGQLGETVDLLGDALAERVVHVGAEPPVVRLAGVPELLLADRRGVLDDGEPLSGVGGRVQLDVGELDQRLPVARRLVERLEDRGDLGLMLALGEDQLEGRPRRGAVGVDLEDRPVGLDRLAEVLDVVLEDLTHAELQGDDLLLVRRDGDLPLQVVDQGLPALEAGEDPVELGDRLAVLGVDVEDREVASDRVVDALQLRLQHPRDSMEHPDLRRRIRDVRGLVGEHRDQLLVIAGDVGEPMELRERALVGRLDHQRAGVGRERAVELLQLPLVDVSDLVQELDLPGGVRRLADHHLVHVDELLGLRELAVVGREDLGREHRLVVAVDDTVQRRDRRRVVRRVREGVAVGLDRAHDVGELVLVERADPVPQGGLLVALGRDLDGPLEDPELVGPALRLTVEPIERLDGVVVGGLEVEDRAVGLDRLLDVLELLVVDLPELVQPVATVLRDLRELRLAPVDVLELLPRLGLREELGEGVERSGVGVVEDQDLLVQGDRAGEILHRSLTGLSRVEEERLPIGDLRHHLRLADDRLDERVEVGVLEVEADQRVDRLEVAGVDAEDPLVARSRLGGVLEDDLVDLGDLHEQPDDQVVVDDVGDRLVVERDEARVVAHLARDVLEALLRPLVARIDLEGAAERLEGLHLLVAADLVELGDPLEQADLLLHVARVRDHDLVALNQALPVVGVAVEGLEGLGDRELLLLVGQEGLERRERRRVRGIEGQDAVVGLDRLSRLIELGQAEIAETQVELDLLGRIRRQGELALEVLSQLDPRAPREVEAVQRDDRLEVLELVGQDLVVGGDRLLLLAEHLVLQVRDAEPELLPLRPVAGQGDLAAEHAEQLAPVLVAAVELLQGRERLDVVRVDVEGTLEVLDRLRGVPEALVVEVRQPHQEGALQVAREVPPDRLLEERREVGEAALELRELLELGLSGLVPRVLPEGPAVGVERGGGVADVVGEDRSDQDQQLDALGDAGGGGDLNLEGLHHPRPVHKTLVDREQDPGDDRLQGVGLEVALEALASLFVGGIDGEDLPEELDGVGGRGQLVLLDDAEAEQERGADVGLIPARDRELPPQDVRQLDPLALAEVEAIEGRQGVRILHAGREHGLVGGDRRLDLAELLVDAAHAGLDRPPILVVVRERELGAEHAEQVLLPTEREEEALERGEGGRLLGVDLEDRLVRGERRVEVARALLIDLGELEAQRDAVRIGAVLLDRRAEGLDLLGPGADRLAETEEVPAHVALGVVLGEGLPVEREGRRRILGDPLGEVRQAPQEHLPLRRILAVVQLDLQRDGDVSLVAGLLVEGREGDRDGEVVVVEREGALQGLDGLVGLVHPSLVQVGDLEEQRGALGALGGLRLALEHADELAPLVLLGVELLQALHVADGEVELLERVLGAPVLGVELVERLPRLDRAAVVVQLVAVVRPELDEVVDLLRLVALDLGQGRQDAGELGPLLLAVEQALELLERLHVVAVGRQDLRPELDRQGVLLDLRDRGAGDVEELLHALSRVLDQRQLLLLDVDELLPVAALGVEVLELGDRFGVELVRLEHRLEALDRLGLVVELVEEEAAGLKVKGGAADGIRGELRPTADPADQVGPPLHLLELHLLGLDDLEQGLGVVRVLQDLLEGSKRGDHEARLPQVIAVDVDELPVRGLGLLEVLQRVALQVVLEQVRDVAPLAGLGVELAHAGPRVPLARELLGRVAPRVECLGPAGGLCVARRVDDPDLFGEEELPVDLHPVGRDGGQLRGGLLRRRTLALRLLCSRLLRRGGLLRRHTLALRLLCSRLLRRRTLALRLLRGGLLRRSSALRSDTLALRLVRSRLLRREALALRLVRRRLLRRRLLLGRGLLRRRRLLRRGFLRRRGLLCLVCRGLVRRRRLVRRRLLCRRGLVRRRLVRRRLVRRRLVRRSLVRRSLLRRSLLRRRSLLLGRARRGAVITRSLQRAELRDEGRDGRMPWGLGCPESQELSGVLDVLPQVPGDLAAEHRHEGCVGRIGDHLETARGQLDETVRIAAALRGLLEQVQGAEVPVALVLVLEGRSAGRVRVLERLAEEVRGHVRVVEAHLPDQRELTEQVDLLGRVLLERGPAILQLLDVLQVSARGQEGLGDVARLLVAGLGVEGLEQERQETRVFGRLLLEDSSCPQEQSREVVPGVLDVGGERVRLAAQRDEAVVADVLEGKLPVAAVVQDLLEAVLELLVAPVGARRRLEVRTRLIDLPEVEQGAAVGVVEAGGARRISVRAQLERHQLGDHLEVGHLLVDLPRRLQGSEVLPVALDGRLVERHRLGLVEQHPLASAREVVERGGLGLRRTCRARLRLEFVDHPAPLGDLGEP